MANDVAPLCNALVRLREGLARHRQERASHTYDLAAAQAVVAAIPDFLEEVEHLHAELKRRLG